MTDRPILGALPPGENREYLEGRPGVYLAEPMDVDAMTNVIERLATRFFGGDPICVDRHTTWSEIDSTKRKKEFRAVVEQVVE